MTTMYTETQYINKVNKNKTKHKKSSHKKTKKNKTCLIFEIPNTSLAYSYIQKTGCLQQYKFCANLLDYYKPAI